MDYRSDTGFIKEEMNMARKYTKKCSILNVYGNANLNSSEISSHPPECLRLAKQLTINTEEDMGKQNPYSLLTGLQSGTAFME